MKEEVEDKKSDAPDGFTTVKTRNQTLWKMRDRKERTGESIAHQLDVAIERYLEGK